MPNSTLIIALGRGIRPDGRIPKITQNRAKKAVRLFKQNPNSTLLISAGYWGFQRFTPPNTEAKPMKAIALSMGVPASKIILEEISRDTLGNAYFTRLIADKHGWKKIIVVTSKDHLERTKYYFEKVYGPGYELRFVLAETGLSKKALEKIAKFEKLALKLANLKNVQAGDLKEIGNYIFKKHIMYNGSILKKIIPFFIKQPYNKD